VYLLAGKVILMCGSWKSLKTLFSVSVFLLPTTTAKAIEPKDASYFCVAEAAGGLSFNAVQKRWVGSVFKTNEKFVLRLKFIDVKLGTGKWDKDQLYANFEVGLTPSGTNSESRCIPLGAGDKKTVSINQYNGFTCFANIQDYYFNLGTNRYMNVYAIGYTDGMDNNDNTPGVTGGVCTKIN
jgi:hypothetical protein